MNEKGYKPISNDKERTERLSEEFFRETRDALRDPTDQRNQVVEWMRHTKKGVES